MSDKMTTIFAVTCTTTPELWNIKFFSSKEKAQHHLKALADERRNKFGITYFQDEIEYDGSFEYLFGWEERKVKFVIVELSVD